MDHASKLLPVFSNHTSSLPTHCTIYSYIECASEAPFYYTKQQVHTRRLGGVPRFPGYWLTTIPHTASYPNTWWYSTMRKAANWRRSKISHRTMLGSSVVAHIGILHIQLLYFSNLWHIMLYFGFQVVLKCLQCWPIHCEQNWFQKWQI